ncbi:hypothetical protein O6H91_03G017700 [Diphasiastrum complanatum]|uniref:Uncharacterized protein n=1 Tax=Diphasiastrum complanatum TaxID=34168 RepID=A0ACC2E3R7_DIPCM|nr:hypothetical protein O6H91_03G017700 [Diphasiastrum complanatum]
MPSLSVDASRSSRIFTQREIMIALAGASLICFALILGRVRSTVVLVTSTSDSLPFPDLEASFAPRIPGAGILGMLYAASPLDACQPLKNHPPSLKFPFFPIVIVARGECVFEAKVQHAQNAGFAAVIVYNNEDKKDLVTMSGNPLGIRIPAVFVSKTAGDILLKYAGDNSTRCYILPTFENTAWSVMAVSFISLLAVTAVLATFFFVRRHRLRHLGSRLRPAPEALSMSSKEVKALPSFVLKCAGDGNVSSETCAICLEDYETGEKLRVLPCHHVCLCRVSCQLYRSMADN